MYVLFIAMIQKLQLSLSLKTMDKHNHSGLALSSIDQYKSHWLNLNDFLEMIGDYSSMLMLLDSPPAEFCPSMCPTSILHYINYRNQAMKDTVLLDGDNEPICDVLGEPILVKGGWTAPGNVEQLLSAITTIHIARNQRGDYQDICDMKSACICPPIKDSKWISLPIKTKLAVT